MTTAVHRRQLKVRDRYRLESAMRRTGDGDICVPVRVMSDLLTDAGLWRMAEHVDCYVERLKTVPALFMSALLAVADERAERLSGQRRKVATDQPPVRHRGLQNPTRWPPGMSQADIERAVDAVCGCQGRWDCDCVSVFNKARGDAWAAHNTGKGADR
jgi:hypothetical protein